MTDYPEDAALRSLDRYFRTTRQEQGHEDKNKNVKFPSNDPGSPQGWAIFPNLKLDKGGVIPRFLWIFEIGWSRPSFEGVHHFCRIAAVGLNLGLFGIRLRGHYHVGYEGAVVLSPLVRLRNLQFQFWGRSPFEEMSFETESYERWLIHGRRVEILKRFYRSV